MSCNIALDNRLARTEVMTPSPEIALFVGLLALLGVLVNALVAANNSRKRGELDAKLVELKSRLDQFNALELAKVQAEHSVKLKTLEFDQTQHAASEEQRRSVDSANVAKLLEVLDPERVISFLRTHDFHGIFDRDECDSLFRFLEISKRPDAEFLEPELEALRSSLVSIGSKLSRLLALKTHPRQGTFSSVLPESQVNEERPAWVNKNADEINDSATAFVEVFEQLVRHARLSHAG